MSIILDRLITVGIMPQILLVYILFGTCLAKNIPAIYIFGDSLVDVGNNFYVNTLARPVFPNGIDFGVAHSPSGRYTNGRTVNDIIGQDLGFKNFTPPYLAPTTVGDVVLKGVNYASSASGILNSTGTVMGANINLDSQISNFAKTRQDIISRIGKSAAKRLLRQALYLVAIGSNEILSAESSISQLNFSSQDAYLEAIISTFRSQLMRLYDLDARKVVVTNCGAAGCIPFEKDTNPSVDDCVAPVNQLAQSYNNKLKSMLAELTKHLKGSKYVYADIYAILEDILLNYTSYGFKNADTACCHVAGKHGGLIPCGSLSRVCWDRSKYVFWDPYHLTETANLIAAKHLMDGGLNYISPMNIQKLVNS